MCYGENEETAQLATQMETLARAGACHRDQAVQGWSVTLGPRRQVTGVWAGCMRQDENTGSTRRHLPSLDCSPRTWSTSSDIPKVLRSQDLPRQRRLLEICWRAPCIQHRRHLPQPHFVPYKSLCRRSLRKYQITHQITPNSRANEVIACSDNGISKSRN